MNTALLTIDDIPSRNTPAIVDFLKSKGIRAVLFAVGQYVEKYYDEALCAVRNGMIVGNHSYSHPAFSTLSAEEAVEEIEKCEAVLEKLYREAGVERIYRPFRFPYGDKGGDSKGFLQTYLQQNGFDKLDDRHLTCPWWRECGLDRETDTFWTFDFEEYRTYTDFSRQDVWDKMHRKAPRQGAELFVPGSRHFLLMHAHDETEAVWPEYWKELVGYLLDKGFVFDEPCFVKK